MEVCALQVQMMAMIMMNNGVNVTGGNYDIYWGFVVIMLCNSSSFVFFFLFLLKFTSLNNVSYNSYFISFHNP